MKEIILKANYDEGFLYNISRQFNTSIRVIYFMPSHKENVDAITLLEMTLNNNYEEILSYFDTAQKTSPYFSFYKVISRTKDKMLVLISLCSSFGSKAIIQSGCFLKGCLIEEDGIYFNLLTSDDDSLYTFIEYLSQCKFKLSILRKQEYNNEDFLTSREKEVLSLAYERGYFCFPKRIKLWELSNELDISVSSLSEVLRKAESKIISQFFSID